MIKKTIKQLREEGAPANNVGDGNIAGTGIGPNGMPGVKPGTKTNPIRRKKFAGMEVFEVDSEYFHRCRMGKRKYHRYENYVGNDEVGEEIRQYGRKDYKSPIILQDNKTGAMTYLRYGGKK